MYRGTDETWQNNAAGYVPFTEGEWQHVAFVKIDVEVLAYKDGVLIHTHKNNNPKVKYEPYPLNFGGWYGTSRFFNGILDDVAIFEGALSEDDIKAIATKGLIDSAAVSLFYISIIISVIDLWRQDATRFLETVDFLAYPSGTPKSNDFGGENQWILDNFESQIRLIADVVGICALFTVSLWASVASCLLTHSPTDPLTL